MAVWDRDVPGPVLGVIALLGRVVLSVAALYIYYPVPGEAFEEIVRGRADALAGVHSAHKGEAIRRIQQGDLLTRKLQVGLILRTGQMDAEVTQAAEDLRERPEDLRGALLADDLVGARQFLPAVEKAYRKCRDCYVTDGRVNDPSAAHPGVSGRGA